MKHAKDLSEITKKENRSEPLNRTLKLHALYKSNLKVTDLKKL